MNTGINLHDILRGSFLRAGYAVRKDADCVLFEPLNLMIEVSDLNTKEFENGGISVMLGIACKHNEKIPEGINEIATGMGDNYENAAEQAFDNWIITDFTPIHDYLCSSGNLLGSIAETASYSGESNEMIGWDLFFGPRLEASQNMNTLEISENKKDQQQMLQTLFQPMTDSLFTTPGFYV